MKGISALENGRVPKRFTGKFFFLTSLNWFTKQSSKINKLEKRLNPFLSSFILIIFKSRQHQVAEWWFCFFCLRRNQNWNTANWIHLFFNFFFFLFCSFGLCFTFSFLKLYLLRFWEKFLKKNFFWLIIVGRHGEIYFWWV